MTHATKVSVITGEGHRRVKKRLRQPLRTHIVIPINHMRKVNVGMSGSSVFATEALTSGYGESSSPTEADSCLEQERALADPISISTGLGRTI